MKNLFNINGLMFWSEQEVNFRNYLIKQYADGVEDALKIENKAWDIIQFEGPILTPRKLVNPNYDHDDIWIQEENHDFSQHAEVLSRLTRFDTGDYSEVPENLEQELGADVILLRAAYENWLIEQDSLVLRPETTPSSYLYAQHLLNGHSNLTAPLCVWQAGKSFRREQDQVTKNMRLKEFYQQEFQCIYSADTKNDYHKAILEPMRKLIARTVCLPTRIVESDRLPDYSEITMDIEVNNGNKWMEIVSISRRTDFPSKLKFPKKEGFVEKDAFVLEIAIGLDRAVFNYKVFADGV